MKREFSYISDDKKTEIHAYVYAPDYDANFKEFKGIVQISHGMTDHVTRYEELAEYLNDKGYIFCGNDHIGHGLSAKKAEDLGFFGEHDGYSHLPEDLHLLRERMRSEYGDIPYFLIGHSMGSFIARLYVQRYPDSLDGAVFMGTGGKNPLLPFGKATAKMLSVFRGRKYRSNLLRNMAFTGYNSKYKGETDANAWITRDTEIRSKYKEDEYCNFVFTVSAYYDLFTMYGEVNSNRWYREYPESLSTLIISGEDDPVGGWGKGTAEVYGKLKKRGVKDLTLKMYEGARHELFSEINRGEFFADIAAWLDDRCKKS